MDRPDFPTMEQVEKADREQLARWYRLLPSGDTSEQRKIQHRLADSRAISENGRHDAGAQQEDWFWRRVVFWVSKCTYTGGAARIGET